MKKGMFVLIFAWCAAGFAVAQSGPRTAQEFFARGQRFARQGEYDKAIADFTEVIRLVPKSPTGYYNRGLSYAKNKDYDKAIADFTEAIRLDPKNDASYHNRGGAE
jgi:tetratricopeptide (TPR) repeat protein